jgi:hypothetical protein
MHMSILDSFFALLLAVGGLFGLPMPIAVPPLPDEPALTRIVPKDAMAFFGWNGTAAADPKSPNQTEQLAAEPEIRAMVLQLRTALAGVAKGEGNDLAAGIFETVLASLERPGCVFVRRFGPRPILEAGIVVRLGDAAPTATRLLGKVGDAFRERQGDRQGAPPLHPDVTADGVVFHAMGSDKEHAFVGWAELDGWVALAIGTEMPAQIVAGLRGKDVGIEANADYAKLAPTCAVARPSTKAFVDLPKLVATLQAEAVEGVNFQPVLDALGLRGATAVVSQTGLDGQGFVQRLRLAAPAGDGLLGAFGGAPLDQGELTHIPLDAQIALSTRFDARKLEAALLAIASSVSGQDVAAEYERDFVGEFPQHVGELRWREDLLDHVGNQVTVWNSPTQAGLVGSGLTLALPLRNGGAFAESLATVMGIARKEMPSKEARRLRGAQPRRNSEYLESFVHKGATVHWIDILDDDVFVAPSWTIVGDHAFGSLLPQALRATLDALPTNPDQSLAKLPLLNKRGAATAMFCWNAKELVALGYPLLVPALKSMSYEWQPDGFDFDVADLPQPRALVPHLGRELLLWEPVAGGYSLSRSGTLPVFDPLTLGLIGGLVALVDEVF